MIFVLLHSHYIVSRYIQQQTDQLFLWKILPALVYKKVPEQLLDILQALLDKNT